MTLKEKFYTIFKTFNPDSYNDLHTHDYKQIGSYMLFIVIFAVILSVILFIPTIIQTDDFVKEQSTHFDNATISFVFTLKEPFTLLDDPVIGVDKDYHNLTNERVLITENNIYYKQFFFFGRTRSIPVEKEINISQSELFQKRISSFMIFLIPSIIVWGIIAGMLYALSIIILTIILGLIIRTALRLSIGYMSIIKIAIYSSTIAILLQWILLPFYRVIFLPIIAYWILFLIILLLMRDSQGGVAPKTSSFKPPAKKTSIFDKQDSVDVDERGNIKSGFKKKKSFSEENDGYVEL